MGEDGVLKASAGRRRLSDGRRGEGIGNVRGVRGEIGLGKNGGGEMRAAGGKEKEDATCHQKDDVEQSHYVKNGFHDQLGE